MNNFRFYCRLGLLLRCCSLFFFLIHFVHLTSVWLLVSFCFCPVRSFKSCVICCWNVERSKINWLQIKISKTTTQYEMLGNHIECDRERKRNGWRGRPTRIKRMKQWLHTWFEPYMPRHWDHTTSNMYQQNIVIVLISIVFLTHWISTHFDYHFTKITARTFSISKQECQPASAFALLPLSFFL